MFTYPTTKIAVAVDCVIFGFAGDRLQVLLVPRGFEPVKGLWSLMGGFIEPQESVDAAAGRVLKELTGLDDVYLDQVGVFGGVDRDPGERVISIVYSAFIKVDEERKASTGRHQAVWVDINELPELIFDHRHMIETARLRLRDVARVRPTGRELLPHRFTIKDLQTFYEVLFDLELDASNFRKKIIATGVLKKLPEKDMSSSRRGAHYYEFAGDQYERPRDFNLSAYLS